MHRRRLLQTLAALPLSACASLALPPTPEPQPSPTADRTAITNPPATLLPLPTTGIVAPPQIEPLLPFPVQITLPGIAGAAILHLYDARNRLDSTWPVMLQDGQATLQAEVCGSAGFYAARLLIDGREVLSQPMLTILAPQTVLQTGQPRFDELFPRIRAFMEQCVLDYELDNRPVRGYRSPDNPLLWLRDHAYQSRGFRYFERDLLSLIDAFRRAQQPDGSLPDFLARPALGVLQPGRKQVEADVEFLFVQAVYEAWQATGDDAWAGQQLTAMREAVRYSLSDPLRWDPTLELIKRPYTIDMWDFEYGPTTLDPTTGKPAPRHWIDDQTKWGIFHGDNTGMAHALELLARLEERLGDPSLAPIWRETGRNLMRRLRRLSWNGRFFMHHVKLAPFDTPGVDEAEQLSLSNTYALNRGVLRDQQARAIIDEYHRRGMRRGQVFAEWYSIDPSFPPGSYGLAGRPGEQPGEYVNGGIMPLTGGELARGAFRYGAERYGFEILHRYYFLISTTNATYLWYYPIGSPGISGVDTLPTDGWGASAMLGALIEGAAGIEDQAALYRQVTISPRWSATDDVQQVRAVAHYAASNAYAAYRWQRQADGLTLDLAGSGESVTVRLLLPPDVAQLREATLDNQPTPFVIEDRLGSRYAVVDVPALRGQLRIRW